MEFHVYAAQIDVRWWFVLAIITAAFAVGLWLNRRQKRGAKGRTG